MPSKKPVPAPEERVLETAAGPIPYTLTRKRVRNLNLRVGPGGAVAVSAPGRMPLREVEAFLQKKAGWIEKHRRRMLAQAEEPARPCRYTKEECLRLFSAVSDELFPLFADLLRGEKPLLQVREMKSRWGSCHPAKRKITLNTRLAEKPMAAIEYVVLHEYVHFLHADHGAGFHAEMARLMPDYKERRRLLR